jgi:predicted RNase H-like nuclease (RuvC/YqgF family)
VGVVAPCFVFMLVVGCHRPRFYPAPKVKEYRRQIDELRGQIEELRRDSLEEEINELRRQIKKLRRRRR